MRRLLRRLLTVLSLLLCAGAAALWARSYTHRDGGGWFNQNGRGLSVATTPGGLDWVSSAQPGDGPLCRVGTYSSTRNPDVLTLRRWPYGLGFGGGEFVVALSADGLRITRETLRGVATPLWAWVMLFAVLPVTKAHSYVRTRWRRARRGLCARCGYDMRASHERCPECGTPAPGAPHSHNATHAEPSAALAPASS